MRKARLKHNLIKFGIAALLRAVNKNPRVIFWHGVERVAEDPSLHISPEIFEEELHFLARHYEVVAMEEYASRFRENRFTGREMVLTFDDGYKNNLTVAAPILKSLQLPFTVFVSAGNISSGEYFPTAIARMVILDSTLDRLQLACLKLDVSLQGDGQRQQVCENVIVALKHSSILLVNEICRELKEAVTPEEYQELCLLHRADRPMNWEEVKKLHAEYGCTIGSHCMDHFICNSWQNEQETARQLVESKRMIEEKLQASCDYLAYPNGVYNDGDVTGYALEMAEKAGYRLAFTTVTDRLKNTTNPFLMPRCAARFEMDDFIMKLVLKPKMSWK